MHCAVWFLRAVSGTSPWKPGLSGVSGATGVQPCGITLAACSLVVVLGTCVALAASCMVGGGREGLSPLCVMALQLCWSVILRTAWKSPSSC